MGRSSSHVQTNGHLGGSHLIRGYHGCGVSQRLVFIVLREKGEPSERDDSGFDDR